MPIDTAREEARPRVRLRLFHEIEQLPARRSFSAFCANATTSPSFPALVGRPADDTGKAIRWRRYGSTSHAPLEATTDEMNLLALPPTLLAFIAGFDITHAQYPPPTSYQTVLKSPIDGNVTISYKQPVAGTCTTAFATQKQYTGYIGLPPYTLSPIQQNYTINTFFWFIEARQTPESAPLTIWLNGGPGSSSMFGLFNEVGPCEMVQMSDGSYGTQMRTFGWDRASNILFIDQPNQVGFSYDTATNGSLNLFQNIVLEPSTPPDPGLPHFMYLNGTFGTVSENALTSYATTANTTEIAAAATWHFLQTWLSTFDQYNPSTRPNITAATADEPAGINLFTESYGGKYAPAFASYFEEQNEAIANGQAANGTLAIRLQSVGIIDGLVDDLIQDYYYPLFAYNNTYDIELIDQTTQLNALNNYTYQCLPAIQSCRSAAVDPYGDNEDTNQLCESAQWTCNNLTALAPFAGYNPYDIRQKNPSPDPPAAYQEYLNEAPVLASIGAKVNYTANNGYVQSEFISTGDSVRGGMVQDLADLLKRGVRVALIFGDADFVCNWYGGQAVAFAIANSLPEFPYPTSVSPTGAGVPPSYANGFASAGFADIVVNDSYVGGAVRQYGNLSFSRVYDAGHFVPFYQPETAFQIFARVILGNYISTGVDVDLSTFASNGTANSTYTNKAPPQPSPTCWVRAWNKTCSDSDTEAMLQGKGVVEDGIFYQNSKSIQLPGSTVVGGVPGSPMVTTRNEKATESGTSTTALTGYYTATSTPSPSGAASALSPPLGFSITTPAILLLGVISGIAVTL